MTAAAVIAAMMWDHVEVVGAVDPAAPPSQADLDTIADRLTAANCGVRPTVRVLEQFALPAFEDTGEPVCEQAQRAWRPLAAMRRSRTR